MRKTWSLLWFIILILLVNNSALAQTQISNIDFNFLYDINSNLRGKIIASRQDSSALVLLHINSPLDSIKNFDASYSIINNLNDVITTEIKINNLAHSFLSEDDNGSQYVLKLKVGDAKYFVLWLTDLNKQTIYPFVKLISRHPNSGNMVLEYANIFTPIFNSYLPINSEISLKSLRGRQESIQVDYYDYHFLPASPPMYSPNDSLAASFDKVNSFSFESTDKLQMVKQGLYYFHLANEEIGQSILVKDAAYPKFSQIDQLVEALRYLTTEEEYQKMLGSINKKELFDEFWLNNTSSEVKAKKAIRAYYTRANEANILFTTYKEGWKTDMGMIYIIFGAPSSVFMDNNDVMWIYSKSFNLPDGVSFTFKHINTAFTDQHYILQRKAEFQNLWFRTVDMWRSGKKEF